MSLDKQNFIFISLFLAFGFSFITALPVPTKDDPFNKFIVFLSSNNCSMPKEVELPFSISDPAPFSYLSTPLEECQSSAALKENNKANLLCREVFDALQNITCMEYNVPLPKINSSHLSADVCKDFAAIQDFLPKQNEYLSRKLGDSIICKVLCTEKYELLCKTLLWSYDTQAKIKKVLDSKGKETMKESLNEVVADKDDQLKKIIAEPAETGPEKGHQEVNEIQDNTDFDMEKGKISPDGSSLSNAESETASLKSSSSDQTPTIKIISFTNITNLNSSKDGKPIKSNSIAEEVQSSVADNIDTQPDTQKVSQKGPFNENVQPGEQNPELLNKNIDQEENSLEKQSKNIKNVNPVTDMTPKLKANTVTSENKDNQNGKPNTSLQGLPDTGNSKDNADTNINVKPGEKSSNPVVPKTDIDNDSNNDGFEEPPEIEIKDKEKQTDLNKKEDTKEGFISDGVTSETYSKLPESTILPIYPDKNEDLELHPEVKDPEQYNDSENDADYAKQEYDTGFSPSLKKDSEAKNSIEDDSRQIASISNIQISPENFPGQGLDGSRNYIPARNYLPEQEDGHFFFYFLSIVLILMAGYLIFHNKQKIIALIVEGRHERRRRSHGAGYKKLETK